MKIYSSGLGTLSKYEMYEPYYKDQYCNNVACIEAVYPELLQDDVIGEYVTEINRLTELLDKRMKDIADLNSGESTSVRLPGKIHDITIKGTVE